MRTRDIGERAVAFLDVGQEEPSLERWMESVRMKLELWIRGSFRNSSRNRLNVIEWPIARARGVSEQPVPAGAAEETVKRWKAARQLRSERHAAGDRIALLLRSTFELGSEDAFLETAEVFLRKQVRENHETVSVELIAQLLRNEVRKTCATPAGQGMGGLDAPNVQARSIERG